MRLCKAKCFYIHANALFADIPFLCRPHQLTSFHCI